MITSKDNPKLQEARKLAARRAARERSGRFVAEGEDLLAAADAAGWIPRVRLCAAGSGLEGEEVEPDLLAGASGLGSGTRALAIYDDRWLDAAPSDGLCIALHGVADPGNVGTVLRSALAFGASAVALGPSTADPFSPKAVRASMGAVFAVPLVRYDDVITLPGVRIALAARAGDELNGPIEGAATVVVGAEREGLPDDVVAACDSVAHLPIASESLNAAMAATVALYELTRGTVTARTATRMAAP
jgi:TrmH family RNA methyltransferase